MLINLFEKVSNKMAGQDKAGGGRLPGLPDEVQNFLGKLSMLEGVPLSHLVPDIKYLPLNNVEGTNIECGALKLFYLDPEWVASLVGGALSLADESAGGLLQRTMQGEYAAKVHYDDTRDKVMRQINGLYEPAEYEARLKKRMKENGLEYGDPSATPAQSNWAYTGFLIRSAIVKRWANIEVVAYGRYAGSAETGRRVVKMQRIGNDTILCICEGEITNIEVIQPRETVHFTTQNFKSARYRPGNKGVLDIDGALKLRSNGGLQAVPADSAALARELLNTPTKAKITFEPKEA